MYSQIFLFVPYVGFHLLSAEVLDISKLAATDIRAHQQNLRKKSAIARNNIL